MSKVQLRKYAKELRCNTTDAERYLWYFLRAKRFGFKFKRQAPISHFIVDFVCFEKRLIIELDGGQHEVNKVYDTQRTIELNKLGFQVLRFWNDVIFEETDDVLNIIHTTLSRRFAPPSPAN